jgi:hypothetical protein
MQQCLLETVGQKAKKCSQQPSTVPYPEQHKYSPTPLHIISVKFRFNIIILILYSHELIVGVVGGGVKLGPLATASSNK